MNVSNMINSNGNKVPNQFVLTTREKHPTSGQAQDVTVFQSYDSVIARITTHNMSNKTTLDAKYWNYSRTTSKYRALFLGETTKQTQARIDSGEYILTDLN